MKYTPAFRHSALLALVLGASLTIPHARATDYIWDATSSGPWTTPGNWNLDSGYPNSSTDNVVGNTSILAVTATGTIAVGTLTPTSYHASRGWSILSGDAASVLKVTTLTLDSSLNTSGNSVQLNSYGAGAIEIGTLNLKAAAGSVNFNTSNNTSGGTWSQGIGRLTVQNTNFDSTAGNVILRLGYTSLDNGTTSDPGSNLGLVTFSGSASASFVRTMHLIYSTGATAGYTETVAVSGLNDTAGIRGTTTIYGGAAGLGQTNLATLKIDVGTGNSYATAAILADGTSSGTNVLAVLKTGAGTQAVSGASTYTGGTVVTTGTLLVNNTTGSGLGTGAVTINGGAVSGSGTFTGNVTVNAGGTLGAGGEGIESLGTGSIVFDGGNFAFKLNSTTGAADLIYGGNNSTLSITSNATLSLYDLGAGTLAEGTKLTLIAYDGLWNSGAFNGYADDSVFLFNGNWWRIDYNDTTAGSNFNGDATLNGTAFVTLTVVPEPGTWVLLALGLLAMLTFRPRKAATV